MLWLSREGSHESESNNHVLASQRFVEVANALLEYDPGICISREMMLNGPIDHAELPITGHFPVLCYKTVDTDQCGFYNESANVIMAGHYPDIEMGCALSHKKLWNVHPNHQIASKFDEDLICRAINLNRILDKVLNLCKNYFGVNDGFSGLYIRVMHTNDYLAATNYLPHSREIFLLLLEMVEDLDRVGAEEFLKNRNYEAIELLKIKKITGTV